jgi:hypothetical protein
MSKKIVVQAYNSDTGVIGPVESESSVVEVFAKASGTSLSVGDFVYLNTSKELVKAVATYALSGKKMATAAVGIVKKVLSSTSCEVTLSGVTTLVQAGPSAGDVLYLSSSSPGTTTLAAPTAATAFCQPVAKVISKTGSTLLIRLLTNSLDESVLDNISRLSTFVTFSNLSTDPALVVGSGKDPTAGESLFVNGDLGATGNVNADSLTVDTSVTARNAVISEAITADSAEIAGAITADSAEIAGEITADSASLVGPVTITGASAALTVTNGYISAQKTSSPLGGIVFAQTKLACGDDAISPNVSIEGSTGKITSFNSTAGGYGSLSVNRVAADADIDTLERLAFIQLAASSSNAATPAGGAWIYSSAIENWDEESKASMLSIDVTGADETNPNTTTLNIYSDLFRCYTEFSMFGGNDIVFASGGTVLPFTGSHVYPCDTEIPVGSCVVLNNGKAELSGSPMSKNCVGLAIKSAVMDTDSLSGTSGGLKVVVAAVGDNRSAPLPGFLVCNENGPVEAGDLLCTSSTPGYLMKQDDDLVRSYTVGKALETPVFDADGKASGVYGFLYCG